MSEHCKQTADGVRGDNVAACKHLRQQREAADHDVLCENQKLLTLSGSASCSQPPSRVRVTFTCFSRKPDPTEAKESAVRRGDYVASIAKKHGVNAKSVDLWTGVSASENGVNTAYCDVCVEFGDVRRAQTVCGVLREKLTDRVTVGRPRFDYDDNILDEMR